MFWLLDAPVIQQLTGVVCFAAQAPHSVVRYPSGDQGSLIPSQASQDAPLVSATCLNAYGCMHGMFVSPSK